MPTISRLFRTLIALQFVLASSLYAQGRPAAVGVQTVELRTLSETVPVFAEIVTARDGAVASRIAGNVEKAHVLAGTKVNEGDLLITLNTDLLNIRLEQALARVDETTAAADTARVRIDRATVSFERIQRLRNSPAFNQGRFDDTEADLLVARSQLAEAAAALKSSQVQVAEARYQLERSEIKAPFAGVVIEVNTIPGAYIQAGSPVVRLLDVASFEIEASIPSRFMTFLEPGQSMEASLETGESLTLELRAILPIENTSTRTRAVRFAATGLGTISNTAIGQSLTVSIPVGAPRDVLSVPKDALVQSPGGWTVFVASEGKAQPRPIEIGLALADRYEVLSGLAPGDQVVVRGNERLRPGQDIAPTPQETN